MPFLSKIIKNYGVVIIFLVCSIVLLNDMHRVMVISGVDFEEKRLNDLAWTLAFCESSQIPDLKILDTNDKYSYGMFQIQMETWEWGCERFRLNCTDIQDYEQGRELFKAFYKVGEAKDHWVNCYRKMKLN